MKLKSLVLVGAMAAALTACNDDSPKTVELKTDVDQFSYGLGLQIGKSLKQQGMEMRVEAVSQGIKDALAGTQQVDDATIQAAAQEVRKRHMLKLKALSDETAKEGEAFLAENGKREGVVTTETGLQYEIVKAVTDPNAAKPTLADKVKVHYHGTLINGSVFDSSIDRGQPAQFPVSAVIKGWQEALQMMKVGEKWKLYIPAKIAYGARSPSPAIPANSALIFDVELLEIVK